MKKIKFKWLSLPRSYSLQELKNPYRGFYSIYRFYAESRMDEQCQDEEVSHGNFNENTLCLVEINLVHFNDKALSQEALKNIETIILYFIDNKKQLILRFLYDWDGKGIIVEPKDFSFILQHMKQLSPLLKTYADEIYILQGLFIGSWGEMHDSRYLSSYHLITLSNELYRATGHQTQIALRSPSHIRDIFKNDKPLSPLEGFSLDKKARFSLFNDAILASETDFGTYGHIYKIHSTNYGDKWIRNDELKYQNEHCKYVSNGGEVVKGLESDALTTIRTLKMMRLSYLNDGYDLRVLNRWKETKLDSSFKKYKDQSLYDYIKNHLGYRYTLKDLKVTRPFGAKDYFIMHLTMVNEGFSPSYHPFHVCLAIRDTSGNTLAEYSLDTDTRYWLPEETVEIKEKIKIDILEKGSYILSFKIYDKRSRRFIELDNTHENMDSKGFYDLGHIHIKG